MKTKINNNNSREKYILENPQTNELDSAITNTKKEIEALKNIENDNPPMGLEVELAKIFGLDSKKIAKIKAEHNQKRSPTMASVMDDLEKFVNMKRGVVAT